MRHRFSVLAVAVGVLAGCASTPTTPPPSGGQGAALPTVKKNARTTGDSEVTFDSGGVTVHGSLRYPPSQRNGSGAAPAAIIIAGSGPTDRDGNNKALPGEVGNLKYLAEQLEADGVASLRYDKLGAGKTGLAGVNPNDIDFTTFVQEARDALTFLASQPDIDKSRLMVLGHSEGGLIALVVGTSPQDAPPPTAIAMINPLPMRYLDLVAAQLQPKADAQTMAVARQAIDAIRSGAPLPAVPPALLSLFNPSVTKFLHEADLVDPVQLAATVDPSVKVLVTCADQDIQVPCSAVQRLGAAFPPGIATVVTLTGVDHVLKETNKSDGTEYTQPLSFSTQLKDALKQFVTSWTG